MTQPHEPIDTSNTHLVGVRGDEILVMLPPTRPMSRAEALRFAAWLVALADFDDDQFPRILDAVRNT